ncbi:MAG: MGMT family protein [Bacillati bacterium ANGP1]|uniref:MGMT family protein n=1 Tax=Candidatus Segetimicrobium genomatis TaxID=2569760 RepID=A0A537L5B3_9BACT|nr:MAG: MGMT family protein [Terrabacteria group bacterium ANGP1]
MLAAREIAGGTAQVSDRRLSCEHSEREEQGEHVTNCTFFIPSFVRPARPVRRVRSVRGWRLFVERVHALVRAVPKGRVATYGQIARLAGRPRAAREVGWIAHAGGDGIPWQRIVNRTGGLASGYSGGRTGHRRGLPPEAMAALAAPAHRVRRAARRRR